MPRRPARPLPRRSANQAPLDRPERSTIHSIAAFPLLLRRRVRYVVFMALVAGALGAVTLGPTFRIKRVEVYGTLLLDPSTVVRTANLVGANPFLVNTAAVEQQVLALGVPERASVSLILPDTAVVQVAERVPAYIWKVDPTMYLVAADGTVLGQTEGEHGRVIVVDLDHRPVQPGKKVDAAALQEAAYLLHALPIAAHLSPRYLFYSRDLGIVTQTHEGIQIAFGDNQDLELKLQELGPTLDAAMAAHPRPTLVDLQYPHHPYFR